MVDSCALGGLDQEGDGIFVVVDGEGNALQPDGTWGDLARSFHDVQEARAARPGHADGTATSRVIFASQRKKFKACGCLISR